MGVIEMKVRIDHVFYRFVGDRFQFLRQSGRRSRWNIGVDDNDLILSNVLNYPNPFINYTEFWFNHNKPNETIEVLIQIFTVSGKLIKTLTQSVQSDGLLSREITWNGLDDFGNKIGKGVYIYKLQVKSLNSNSKAEKIEKLVILQ